MTSIVPRIIMCRPTHFGVHYEINPWMQGKIGLANNQVAYEQWTRLHEILSTLTEVDVIEGAETLPDMCFVANAGLILGDRFVPSRFRFPQRQPEEARFIEWFSDAGFEIVPLRCDDTFEGEGDALFAVDPALGDFACLWAGYGVRSSLDSHRVLTEQLAVEVVSLRLVDERFYHLDTCFFPLPESRVVYYPAAFDEFSLAVIRHRVPSDRRIEVSEQDALRFACNAVRVERNLVMNFASPTLQSQLTDWGYTVQTTPMDEFILAGGAAKCLCLQSNADKTFGRRGVKESPICDTHVVLQGHLLDRGTMNQVFDQITDDGCSFQVEQFVVGQRHDQPSTANIRVTAPNPARLEWIKQKLQFLGAVMQDEPRNVTVEKVTQAGVAPQSFYSTTIYPTEVRVDAQWVRASKQRMDAVIVIDGTVPSARCVLIRDLFLGDEVVCGIEGVRVKRPPNRVPRSDFSFMSAGVSSERRVELAVEELAWELRRIKARQGRIVFVAGPVVIHTGGAKHLANIIRLGYLNALLTGNALPTHDIEMNLYGTSLGVDLARGAGVRGGHQHHIKAINRIRAAGSIRAAVERGIVTDGIMHACVQHNVDYVLAGSIRDDGPLPDTLMDLCEAQAAYAKAIDGADIIVMLATMLHAIGTGNMTPAGVRLVCVDITPAVVTKLADRGSVESTGIVTDVGLFLNLLAQNLTGTPDNRAASAFPPTA